MAGNEYGGVGHHTMAATLRVVPRDQWKSPTAAVPPAFPTTPPPRTGQEECSHESR